MVVSQFSVFAARACAAETTRPNILVLLTDDQRWDALGSAGNRIVQTPEMDRLAREGTMFLNAFATSSICAASRATIFTGQYERSRQIHSPSGWPTRSRCPLAHGPRGRAR